MLYFLHWESLEIKQNYEKSITRQIKDIFGSCVFFQTLSQKVRGRLLKPHNLFWTAFWNNLSNIFLIVASMLPQSMRMVSEHYLACTDRRPGAPHRWKVVSLLRIFSRFEAFFSMWYFTLPVLKAGKQLVWADCTDHSTFPSSTAVKFSIKNYMYTGSIKITYFDQKAISPPTIPVLFT